MRLDTVYLYVSDMKAEAKFWTAVLQTDPVAIGEERCVFAVGSAQFGLLLDEDLILPVNSSSVLVFEVADKEIDDYIARAQVAGGGIVMQGLSSRIIMASPSGHLFELTIPKPAQSAA